MEAQQTETKGIKLVQLQDKLNQICTDNLKPMEATMTLLEGFFANYDSTNLLPHDRIEPMGELCFKSAENISSTIKSIENISEDLGKFNHQKGEVIPIDPASQQQEQSESYRKKYNECLDKSRQLAERNALLIEHNNKLIFENKTLREMFSRPAIPEEALSYLQEMIADDAFQKMIDQYRLLKSIINPFFLLFSNFDDNAAKIERITDDCYNYSQTMLKTLDDFDDKFYPIIELAEVRLSELKREIKQNVQ